MSAENIIKSLSLGESATSNEIATIDFAGYTWHVKAFVGAYPKATVLLEGERSEINQADIIGTLIQSACVVMASLGIDRKEATRALSSMIAEEYDEIARNMERAMAARVRN